MTNYQVLKYFGMFVTAAIGIVGSWFFKFTVDNPETPYLKDLTPAGYIGLPITVLAFAALIGSTIWTEIKALKGEAEANKNREKAENAERERRGQLSDINSKLATLARDPNVLAAASGNPTLKDLLTDVTERIGGRTAMLGRLAELHPKEEFFPDSIAVLTVFSMRMLSTRRFDQVGAELGSVLYGLESDIALLQEIGDELVLKKLVEFLPGYDYFYGGIPSPRRPGGSGLAFLYRQQTVEFLDPPRRVDGEFFRPPMYARVKIHTPRGELSLTIANFHNRWPTGHEPRTISSDELDALGAWFSESIPGKSIIIGGTFFFEEARYDRSRLEKMGAFFPVDELPPGVSTVVKQGRKDRRFTQFIVSENLRPQYIEKSVIVEELVKVFPTFDEHEIMLNVTDHNPVSIVLRLQS